MTQNHSSLTRFAWLAFAAAVATISLKVCAFLLTGSVGLLSDALESVVNLIGAMMALAMLAVAARPADQNHTFGHAKAEYFSSGLEGVLIILAGAAVAIPAAYRVFYPVRLRQMDLGLAIAVAASVVNLVTAYILGRAGQKHRSIALEASAKHLMTDVWTSVAVIAGVAGVRFTGWVRIDPIVAFVVGINILNTGFKLVQRTVAGLMDTAIPSDDQSAVRQVLERFQAQGVRFHKLQTRLAGRMKFISLHVLVPGSWTVSQGHELLDRIESEIHHAVPGSVVFTHLEPLDAPTAWDQEHWE